MQLNLDKNEVTLNAEQVLWIAVNGFSVRVVGTDKGGIKIGVWPMSDSDSLVSLELPASCGK